MHIALNLLPFGRLAVSFRVFYFTTAVMNLRLYRNSAYMGHVCWSRSKLLRIEVDGVTGIPTVIRYRRRMVRASDRTDWIGGRVLDVLSVGLTLYLAAFHPI
jgi:hypothetical protein